MDETRTTTLYTLLDLGCCLEDYGLYKPMMVDFLLKIIERITMRQIDDFCTQTFLGEVARSKGYGEEDFEACRANLIRLLSPIIVE